MTHKNPALRASSVVAATDKPAQAPAKSTYAPHSLYSLPTGITHPT